ncbi:hypothetical protein [Gimesia sp.]|uniref:hypothetical protein n=1 Tax=Gimesia sp. TaxID=2024833 RepID=UPI003A94E23A
MTDTNLLRFFASVGLLVSILSVSGSAQGISPDTTVPDNILKQSAPPALITAQADSPLKAPGPAEATDSDRLPKSSLVEEPKPELKRPSSPGEATEVQIMIYVIDIDEINSADQSFASSVYYEARWNNPLLLHQGPGPLHVDLTKIWNPRLTIVGQQNAWKSYPETAEILPDGTVIYRQKVWGHFSQPLNLRDFPFDRQELSLQLVSPGMTENQVVMVPLVDQLGRTSKLARRFSLPDFDILSFQAKAAPYYPDQRPIGVAGFEMKIQVARQPDYYILKVILPLCMIVIMSWLPRWLNPEQSGTNIGISTSAFLTLVAYLFAITVLLPRISYITRIDRFIMLSTLTVFSGLIQTVTNTYLLKGESIHKKRLVARMDFWSRSLYPLILVAVIVISFVL